MELGIPGHEYTVTEDGGHKQECACGEPITARHPWATHLLEQAAQAA